MGGPGDSHLVGVNANAGKDQLSVISELQSVTEYLRVALVFAWDSALRGEFNFYFWRLFC